MNKKYTNIRSGTREDLGFFVRSTWEANYARYLKFLVEHGKIVKFEYEPDTFWFEQIKRGTRSYTPDFKVWTSEENFEYHEVKGYMDAKSKTRASRMKKYFPETKIVMIKRKEYAEISQFARIIPHWEFEGISIAASGFAEKANKKFFNSWRRKNEM